ncbi:MAG: hypothetical protein GY827_11000 [Cytophagales bacterium]|nr:hypothetical protein [Cytophagales bacterium]
MGHKISSIHVANVKSNSERHNFKEHRGELNYIFPEMTELNQHWELNPGKKLAEYKSEAEELYKSQVGQKMKSNTTPIREAVCNLRDGNTMEDLKTLCDTLEGRFGIKAIQIHIHEDEGYMNKVTKEIKFNRHAHIVFDWMNHDENAVKISKKTQEEVSDYGRTLKLDQMDMREMQDITAQCLQMERGEKIEYENEYLDNDHLWKLVKSKNQRSHLSPMQYKGMKEREKLEKAKAELLEFKMERESIGGMKVGKKKKVYDIEKTLDNISDVFSYCDDLLVQLNEKVATIEEKEAKIENLQKSLITKMNKVKEMETQKEIIKMTKDFFNEKNLSQEWKTWCNAYEKPKKTIKKSNNKGVSHG